MADFIWIIGAIAAVLGGGFFYSRYKNHQISILEKRNKELSDANAVAENEVNKAEQKAKAADASRDLADSIYRAVEENTKKAEDSDTPLSSEDMRIAKDIMDNHRS